MRYTFQGTYYKHQKGDKILSLVVGQTDAGEFVQIITNDFSKTVPVTKGNKFSNHGICLNIQTEDLSLTGEIKYHNLSPIEYDIMGPYRIFPMQCKHKVVSMHHRLEGKISLNGEEIDFTDGNGYIEKDSGTSFPSSYMWIQANDFAKPCAVMAAIAIVPLYAARFRGCICVVQYEGKEYRFATYKGAKVVDCTRNRMILEQGKYRLEVDIKAGKSVPLSAPQEGRMTRRIWESVSSVAEFRFYENEKMLFQMQSDHTSFEYENKGLAVCEQGVRTMQAAF